MLKEFTSLTKEELEEVRIANKGKKALAVMHPYQLDSNSVFDEFLEKGKHKPYLLIVFEGDSKFQQTAKRIERLGGKDHNSVLLVRTENGIPQPKSSWAAFFSRFQKLEIKKVIVDGRAAEKVDLRKRLAELSAVKHVSSFTRRRWNREIRVTETAGKGRSTTWKHCAGNLWANFKAKGYRTRMSRKFA